MRAVTPSLTFAGSSYTADASSAFVNGGLTLTPGASIEVHGTRISYPASGSEVVIGISTQSLSFATITPPVVVVPVFTLDGAHTQLIHPQTLSLKAKHFGLAVSLPYPALQSLIPQVEQPLLSLLTPDHYFSLLSLPLLQRLLLPCYPSTEV